jgi:membrane protease YdiL (CAAX protease family)
MDDLMPLPAEPVPEGQVAPTLAVPWTPRDVWLGVGFLLVWMAVSFGGGLAIRWLQLEIDSGLVVGLAELLILLPVWWLAKRKYGATWRDLGLRGFQGWTLGLGCGLVILSFFFNLLYSLFLALFGLRAQVDYVAIFANLSSPWWLLLAGIVVAPVVEEIFFRGFLFAGLRGRYGWQRAALISAALFALIHVQPLAVPPIFILGLIFAFLYQRSGSIWPAIAMHVSTNALGLGAAYLAAKMGVRG